MFVTAKRLDAWLIGEQSLWRRLMLRETTWRSLLGWGVAAVGVFILMYVRLGEGEEAHTRIFASMLMSIAIAMTYVLWDSMKSSVSPGSKDQLVYRFGTPIWDLIMVPTVVKYCDDAVVKRRVDALFRFWRDEFESVPVPEYYKNWLLADALADENDELYDRLFLLAEITDSAKEMAAQYDSLLLRQVFSEMHTVEEELKKSDKKYQELSDEWERLSAIRTSL